MASLSGSTAVYLFAAGLNAAVPFFVLPLLARLLGPSGFGLVGTYLAAVNVAAVLAGLSAHGVISAVHFREGPARVPAYIGACLKVLLFTSIPLVTALGLASAPLERLTGLPAAWSWTIGVAAASQFIVSLSLAVFQIREQPLRYGALQVGVSIGWSTLSLLLIGIAHWGWEARAVAQILATSVAGVAALWALSREHAFTLRATATPVTAVLRFGVPLIPHSLSAAVMSGADRLLLSGLVGAEVSGQYFAAFQVCAVITVAAAAMNQAWVPWLYRRLSNPTPDRIRAVVRATYAIYGGLIGLALLLGTAGPWLLPAFAGHRFEPAGPLMHWLAPAAALSGMYYFVTNYLFFTGRTGVLSSITVVCSALQLGLLAILVPRWGAEGAAMSVFATALVYWMAAWAAAHRVVPMPWSLRRHAAHVA